jgi:hypothetical protein
MYVCMYVYIYIWINLNLRYVFAVWSKQTSNMAQSASPPRTFGTGMLWASLSSWIGSISSACLSLFTLEPLPTSCRKCLIKNMIQPLSMVGIKHRPWFDCKICPWLPPTYPDCWIMLQCRNDASANLLLPDKMLQPSHFLLFPPCFFLCSMVTAVSHRRCCPMKRHAQLGYRL